MPHSVLALPRQRPARASSPGATGVGRRMLSPSVAPPAPAAPAASISVVAVFLPLAFLTDEIGMLFREFGVTLAGAVVISGVVALSL